jgi:hypothetical protein
MKFRAQNVWRNRWQLHFWTFGKNTHSELASGPQGKREKSRTKNMTNAMSKLQQVINYSTRGQHTRVQIKYMPPEAA